MENNKVGGYSAFRSLDEMEKSIFAQAVNLLGVDYSPLTVSTQVVSGVNYRFLCEAKAVIPDAQPYNVLLTIYVPLTGDSVITEIKQLVVE